MLAYGVTTETMQHSRGAPSGNLFLPLLLGAPVKGASGPLSCVVRLLSSVPVPLTRTWKARPWLLVQAAMKAAPDMVITASFREEAQPTSPSCPVEDDSLVTTLDAWPPPREAGRAKGLPTSSFRLMAPISQGY